MAVLQSLSKKGFVVISIFALLLSVAPISISDWPPNFSVQEASAATVTIRPNAAGSLAEWDTLVGSTRHDATNDDSDATYVETQTDEDQDLYNTDDLSITAGSTINSITITMRAWADGTGATERIRILDDVGGTTRQSSNINITRGSFNDYVIGPLTTNPSGGSWTIADIDDLEVGMYARRMTTSTETLRVSELTVEVDYDPPASTGTLRPDGDGSVSDWDTLVGSTRHDATNDESDATYLESQTDEDRETLDIDDTSIPVGSTIDDVTIYMRAWADGTGASERLRISDELGGTTRDSGNIDITRGSFNDYSVGPYTTDPSGGAWSIADLDDLEVGAYVRRLTTSTETVRVSEFWVEFTYTPPANTLPVASSVSIDSGASAINLTENTTTTVSCTATVTDTDGFADIDSVEAVLYRSGVGAGAADDNNDHYTLTGDSECVPSGGSGNTENYTCDFDVEYYADPTDAGPNVAEFWECEVTPSDGGGEGTAATDNIEMNSLAAIDVTSTINYGSLALGADTGVTNESVIITNTGNVNIDLEISGTDMSCTSGSIDAINQKYGLSDVTYGSLSFVLTTSPIERDADLPQRTNDASPSTVTSYWGLALPGSGAGGGCSGTNTYTAVDDINVD